VHAIRAVDRVRAHVEMLEHAERHQRDDALAVRRDLVQRVAAVIHRERLHPVVFVRREVGCAQRAAVLSCVRFDLLGNVAAVERLALAGGDLFQDTSVFRKLEAFSRARRAAAWHEGLGEAGLVLELRHLLRPLRSDRRRDEKAFTAVLDRALEELLERQFPELRVQLDPRRHAARHADRIPAALRHAVASGEVRVVPRGGRAAGGVEPVQALAVPEDRVGIGADAIRDRLHKGQSNRRGEDRVDRAASGGEHLQAGLRRERLRSGDHVGGQERLARPCIGICPREGGRVFHLHSGLF
jgi:hypothetical protein